MQDTDRLQLIALLGEIDEIEKHLSQSNTSTPTFFGVDPNNLDTVTKKQITLAKRLACAKDGDDQNGDSNPGQLVSIMSSLEKVPVEKRSGYAYSPTVLDPKNRNFIIPTKLTNNPTADTTKLWQDFADDFQKINETYTPEVYQTVFALLHKYTSRIQAFAHDPDVSLYDFLRTTAAIAACIAREGLSAADIDAQLSDDPPQQDLCMLLKGDISGIQSFLYQILSDGAARQLRGRSFYLQLLTEAIAHWVLRQLGLPIVNLLLASGGHFYILAPYTEAKKELENWRKEISEKLWTLHQSDLSFILAGTPVTTKDFKPDKFSKKWDEVSGDVNTIKQKKWSELETEAMFNTLFEPFTQQYEPVSAEDDESKKDPWEFRNLGGRLRHETTHLVIFETGECISTNKPNWETTMKAFGWEVHFSDPEEELPNVSEAKRAIVYRLDNTDFLENVPTFTFDEMPASYDFRLLPQVIPRGEGGRSLDYNNLADASDGVNWLGALRIDVDNLGTIFREELGNNATISRMATLSESLRLFFEGYVPELCRNYNQNPQEKAKKPILELIYAGGDDLFLVGGWSALPEIAKKIRDEFRRFVTGDHVTLSGGIFIEHQKFPLHQFADRSGDAEHAAKGLRNKKDAISFLQKPMAWEDFKQVSEWHQKFVDAVDTNNNPLPRDILTRLSQIYSTTEDYRWAWRSLYYFHQMRERYKKDNQRQFLRTLERELNETGASFELKEFIRVVTRWAALQTRKTTKEN